MAQARKTDPQTSHDAARSVSNSELVRAFIYDLLKTPMTDNELLRAYATMHDAPLASESGIRSRRAELVEEGMAYATGERRPLPTGRTAMVWARTEVAGC